MRKTVENRQRKDMLKQIIYKSFPLAVLKVIVFRSVSDCSEATVKVITWSLLHDV